MNRTTIAALAAIAMIAFSAPAEARSRHAKPAPRADQTVSCDQRGCSDHIGTPSGAENTPAAGRRAASRGAKGRRMASYSHPTSQTRPWSSLAESEANAGKARNRTISRVYEGIQDMGGRSGSCLRFRATAHLWCGCASADHVGLDNSDGRWNLAANWFSLPRAAPAPGMAAVRSGHVAILKSEAGPGEWIAFDPNSGHQRAHVHVIRLSRFSAVVDPHGTPGLSRYGAGRSQKSHHALSARRRMALR